jgi:hypothetical protein
MNIALKTILIASSLTLGGIGTASAQIGVPYGPYWNLPLPANPSAPKQAQEHRSASARPLDHQKVQRAQPSHDMEEAL